MFPEMDEEITAKLEQLTDNERNITGVLISDKQGLCLQTSGNAKAESSGTITAIVDLVAKLEPDKPVPQVILESDNKCCIIHSGTNMIAAVFKNILH